MILYGDRVKPVETASALDLLAERLSRLDSVAGLERHAHLVEALIEAGELLQGIADAEVSAAHEDDDTPAQAAAMDVLLTLARHVASSWYSGFSQPLRLDLSSLDALKRVPFPPDLVCKVPEGYAYYAVYPELFLEAAGSLRCAGSYRVIGLRSIGTSLAAVVAAALGAPAVTLRPFGDPFDRRVAVSPRLKAKLLGDAGADFAVVDEGPGLSGSSFVATADMLEASGVAPERIVFLPSHEGDPGPRGKPRHRARWSSARKICRPFEPVFITTPVAERRLENWVADLIGPTIAPLIDISAGRWRQTGTGATPAPVLPRHERRKFIAQTHAGAYLLKFTGLGTEGRAKACRARELHMAGFTPPVLGFRHGFLVQQWREDAQPFGSRLCDREWLLIWLGEYISFRARRFPADRSDGASLCELVRMLRANTGEALGEPTAIRLERRITDEANAVTRVRPINIDGRLHSWEWLETAGGGLVKTDAVDHSRQHDLIGCQDPCWDIAGAKLEFQLTQREVDRLIQAISARLDGGVDRHLLAVFDACYPAFQLGLWQADPDMAVEETRLIEAHTTRYREALLELAA
jgi:hypothetical protein